MDLLVASLRAERIGYLDDPNVVPCVGNDAYWPSPPGELALPVEGIYWTTYYLFWLVHYYIEDNWRNIKVVLFKSLFLYMFIWIWLWIVRWIWKIDSMYRIVLLLEWWQLFWNVTKWKEYQLNWKGRSILFEILGRKWRFWFWFMAVYESSPDALALVQQRSPVVKVNVSTFFGNGYHCCLIWSFSLVQAT